MAACSMRYLPDLQRDCVLQANADHVPAVPAVVQLKYLATNRALKFRGRKTGGQVGR